MKKFIKYFRSGYKFSGRTIKSILHHTKWLWNKLMQTERFINKWCLEKNVHPAIENATNFVVTLIFIGIFPLSLLLAIIRSSWYVAE